MKIDNDTSRLLTQLRKKKLTLGVVYVTQGIMDTVAPDEFVQALNRHSLGDWGEICDEDWDSNDRALVNGSRVLSVYTTPDGDTRFWIITDADRAQTTGLLPEEY